jgi:hypothetical protein
VRPRDETLVLHSPSCFVKFPFSAADHVFCAKPQDTSNQRTSKEKFTRRQTPSRTSTHYSSRWLKMVLLLLAPQMPC